ncbi:hypothetical protein K0A97_02945 [Patescibacteria group bacterium]|nr:hypothetical protein [Patescibacteria group bacterium]
MNSENLLLVVAVFAVFVSFAGVIFTFNSVSEFKDTWFTGFYVQEGNVSLNVLSVAAINFTVSDISWGAGQVNESADYAILNTCCGGSVTDGNWSSVSQGFEIRNVGNVNVSLNLTSDDDADSFIGGSDPSFQLNVTNIDSGACTANGITLGQYFEVTSPAPMTICNPFQFLNATDEIRVDVKLQVPGDSYTGIRSTTLTAAFYAV